MEVTQEPVIPVGGLAAMSDDDLRRLADYARAHPASKAAERWARLSAAIDELLSEKQSAIERFTAAAERSTGLLHKIDARQSFDAQVVRAVAESDRHALAEAGRLAVGELTLQAPDWLAALAAWGAGEASDLAGTRRRQVGAMLAALGH